MNKEIINYEFDKLFNKIVEYDKFINNEINKCSENTNEKDKEMVEIKRKYVNLARGYAKELGILVYKRKKDKRYSEERIMQMRKLLLFINYKGNTQDKVKEYLKFCEGIL